MNFVDATLLQLTDETLRTNLFDQAALEQIIMAGYETDAVEGPYSALFDQLEFGFSISQHITVDGIWRTPTTNTSTDARFTIAGSSELIQAEAFWQGGIAVRFSHVTSTINAVNTVWPRLNDIDDEIISDTGSLPSDPVALESARRARLQERLQEVMANADALTEASLDSLLTTADAVSVGDLLAQNRGVQPLSALQIAFSEPTSGPSSPQILPITAALLIRDAEFSLSQLLAESKHLLNALQSSSLERARDPQWKTRHEYLVIWIIPEEVFDDDDWPGPTTGDTAHRREMRRLTAGEWLAHQGIGLVTVP
jgi:hypothetical protein